MERRPEDTGVQADLSADVLVEWDDHTQNVVSTKELVSSGSSEFRVGSRVKMWWAADGKYYHGTVIEVEEAGPTQNEAPVTSPTHTNTDQETDDDDVPLARFAKLDRDGMDEDGEEDIPLANLARGTDEQSDTSIQMDSEVESDFDPDPDYRPSDSEVDNDYSDTEKTNCCEHDGCKVEGFAACFCFGCKALLCYDHFTYSDPCKFHCSDPVALEVHVEDDGDVESNSQNCCDHVGCEVEIFAKCVDLACNALLCFDHFDSSDPCKYHSEKVDNVEIDVAPEQYEVDGNPRVSSGMSPAKKKRRSDKEEIRKQAKKNRNLGLPYISEKTGIRRPGKRILTPRCTSAVCEKRKLQCASITETQRQNIIDAFYDLGDLQSQREWIARHISSVKPANQRVPVTDSRKQRTLQYTLPNTDGVQIPVCRKMFLSTCGAAEKMVRTAMSKVGADGILEKDGRGGRSESYKERDATIRRMVNSHIDRFPRMESHYCRQNTSYEYLSPELNIGTMHRLYNEENKDDKVSLSFYAKVFRSKKLKFHHPKKDQCGLCMTYRLGNAENQSDLQERYERHIEEKEQVRKIKQAWKDRALNDEDILAANFDLEQVLFLPISKRGELFYKRKMSCYNFTVYNLGTAEGHCYFWHEGQARRGANEIASSLYDFLKEADQKGIREVGLFCDGCGGQNKNSILPAMLLHFVHVEAKCIERITVYFFETNHGQCEGDSMHSTVERAVKRAGEVMIPSQLAMVIRMARKVPYTVKELQTKNILDWKMLSQDLGILRVRQTDEGQGMDWTKVMELCVDKTKPDKILVKESHLHDQFQCLSLRERRSAAGRGMQAPGEAYDSAPKLAAAKYNDLVSFTRGQTPVITNPEHIAFYKNLPHLLA